MIEDARGNIDHAESGAGPTIVLVPGSCSTAAAWRPLLAAWNDRFRTVTTSLLGYGRTEDRRTTRDVSMAREAEIVEAVIRKAGGAVHLVGHSFGGLVGLAVALRGKVDLASLTLIEPPAVELLAERGEDRHYRTFRKMSQAYIADFASGNDEAIAAMIDFYGGAGTFAAWPKSVRAYAAQTTSVNIRDWATAYGFPLSATALAAIPIPVLVVRGGASHPSMQRLCALLADNIFGAALATIDDAAHFMTATHADLLGRLIAWHVRAAEAEQRSSSADSFDTGWPGPTIDAYPTRPLAAA